MAGVIPVGGDPELEDAGARNDLLDEIDLRLVDLRNDHLELVEAVATDGDFLLTARIDTAGHRRDELVHVDRRRPPLDLELQIERIRGHRGFGEPDLRTAEIELLDAVDERRPGGGVGGLELHADPAVGRAGGGAEAAFAGCEERLDLQNRILDLTADLLRAIDFIDEDHASLEVDAEAGRPPQGDDRQAGDERRQHGGEASPHVGGPQRLGEEPGEDRRHENREQRQQPDAIPHPPPRECGGCRGGSGNVGGGSDGGLGEGKDEERKHGSQTHFRCGSGFGSGAGTGWKSHPLDAADSVDPSSTDAIVDRATWILTLAASSTLRVTRPDSRSTLATVP